MRIRHFLVLTAALLAVVMAPTAARADTRFHADSGDACLYGVTSGVLIPRLTAVHVQGLLTDRPVPFEPSICRDDGFFSVATFSAFAGDRLIDQQAVRANNGAVKFEFTLGTNSTVARVETVVIQVCRTGINLPRTYCGRAVKYGAPF